MGCGSSSAVVIEISASLDNSCSSSEFVVELISDISGSYSIQSGLILHTLVLLEDGKLVLDGVHARSVVYKQGKKEFFFTMAPGTSATAVSNGEIRFSDSQNMNGVFYSANQSSGYVVQGTRTDAVSDEQAGMKATIENTDNKTVIIDDSTLKRYQALERKMEKYVSRDMVAEIRTATLRGEELQKTIKQKVTEIEELQNSLKIAKETSGEDSREANSIEIELESKCLSLAADEEEYENVLKYIRKTTADLFDYNILKEEFDDLLNVMFEGNNGSEMEKKLEAFLEEQEEARRDQLNGYRTEEETWEDAKSLCTIVLQALNTWSSLQRDDYQDKQRLFLAKQTRSKLVLISDGIVALQKALMSRDVESNSFGEQIKCLEKIQYFKSNIFEMYSEETKIEEGVDILLMCKETTSNLEQVIYQMFKLEEHHQNTETLKKDILATKMQLKQERQNLIQQWLSENVGDQLQKEDTVLSIEDAPDEDTAAAVLEQQVKEEFDITQRYETILSKIKQRENEEELAKIRSDLELQDKIRARRQRQRHQRAQKIIEAQT